MPILHLPSCAALRRASSPRRELTDADCSCGAAKPARRSLVKRARVARRLVDSALAEISRACADEIINKSKPVGRAVECLNAALGLLKEDA